MYTKTTITMQPEIADAVKEFAKKKDMTISAVYRRGALELIGREGNYLDEVQNNASE